MKPKGIFILGADSYEKIYGPSERRDVAELVDVYEPPRTRDFVKAHPESLDEAEIVFSGWGAPVMDEEFLNRAPRLQAVFYGAGSVRYFVTDALWDRDIVVTSAHAANALPVAEYTLASILYCLRHAYWYAREVRSLRRYPRKENIPGAYGTTVGIISLGMVGRMVCERLRPFDVRVIAYDPYVSAEDASKLGVELVSLETLFREAEVISLHTPWLPETVGMITGEHFASMKTGASFINTARGAIVREQEMIDVLGKRPDLQAVLDVTYPEPPAEDSPLYILPNVFLTPHIAGSQDNECRRMGRYMVDELRRYLSGEPLRWRITREKAALLA